MIFPSGSRTGENTLLSAALGFPAFSKVVPLATMAAVVEPLRMTGRAGDPAAVPALVRVCTGDGPVLEAAGRRVEHMAVVADSV